MRDILLTSKSAVRFLRGAQRRVSRLLVGKEGQLKPPTLESTIQWPPSSILWLTPAVIVEIAAEGTQRLMTGSVGEFTK